MSAVVGLEKAWRPGKYRGTVPKRRRGFGNVFLRGNIWWMRYPFQGKERRESCRTINRRTAVLRLRARVRMVATTASALEDNGRLKRHRWLDAPRKYQRLVKAMAEGTRP